LTHDCQQSEEKKMDSILPPQPAPEESHFSEMQALVSSVVTLLDLAKLEIDEDREAAKATIGRASSLLRIEIDRRSPAHGQAFGTPLLAWQARRVREYIDAHIGTRILISNLSAIAKRSEAHFARAFKQTFGLTPHAYVVRRRVEIASHLMRVSEDSLSNIACACGFTDQAHFCRLFRQCVGQSPAAWRRERCEPLAPIRRGAPRSAATQRGRRLRGLIVPSPVICHADAGFALA
jgi:AraC family transcriptional regulator